MTLAAAGEAAAPAAEGSDAPELANYAKGGTVTVSSTETADFPGELAVDGDLTTRWASQYTDDETITVDMGAIRPIGYIELYWETALASDFEIYSGSAADNLQEHTIATVTGNSDTHNVFEFDLTTARYITIHCSKRATEWGNSLYEIIVRKSADEVNTVTGPAGYPSSGVSVPDGSVIINGARIGLEEGWGGNAAAGRDAAFDGDINTFFDPLGTGNGWAGIDAGEEYTLTKIAIHPRDGQLARFNGAEIDGSNDPEFNDYTPIWISIEEADEFKWYEIDAADFDDIGSFRYYRYYNMTNHGDVADVELYGYPTAGGPGSAAAPAAADPNAPALLWDFNSDEAISENMGANSNNGVSFWGEKDGDNDYYVFVAGGNDPYVSVDLSADDVSDVVWAKARVKNSGPATAIELFGHTDGRGLTGSECTHINLATDGEWHTYIIYIPDENVATVNAYKDPQYAITEPYWAGTVDWIRLDPMWREGDDGSDSGGSMESGDEIAIDYIAFFPTEDAAKAFRSEQDSYVDVAATPGLVNTAVSYPASGADGNAILGTVIGNETGWGDNAAAGAAAAFDGDAATFFDPLGVGDGFCGIDAGEPYILDKAVILSRADWNDRFVGAMIQGSNDGENWTTLWTSDTTGTNPDYFTVTEFENNTGYSQFRYFNETNHGDVAEVEFYGQPGKVEAESKGFADVNAAAAGKNVITGYEFVSGSEGFGGEGPENLFDGETGTKFCTGTFPAEAVAKLDGVYNLTGFTMATANDNADYNGRSPSDWTISVSSDGENWTEFAKGDDSFFEETNFTYYAGEAAANGVSYVKFSAAGTASGTFQVSELTFFGDKDAAATDAATSTALSEKEEAPNTFDFGVVAAVAAVVSLAGFAVARKRH